MMSGIDVDADGDPVGGGVDRRADGPQGLSENDRCAAVQQPVGLGVALHGHRGHQPLGRDVGQDHPHLLRQRTHALRHHGDELFYGHLGWRQRGITHVGIVAETRDGCGVGAGR